MPSDVEESSGRKKGWSREGAGGVTPIAPHPDPNFRLPFRFFDGTPWVGGLFGLGLEVSNVQKTSPQVTVGMVAGLINAGLIYLHDASTQVASECFNWSRFLSVQKVSRRCFAVCCFQGFLCRPG